MAGNFNEQADRLHHFRLANLVLMPGDMGGYGGGKVEALFESFPNLLEVYQAGSL